jgi:hypothetical protein
MASILIKHMPPVLQKPAAWNLSGLQADDSTIHQHKSCAEQSTADNIGKPMYTRNKSANYHESNKCNEYSGNDITEQFVPYATIELHDSRWHNARHKQGC